jgi:hypothetical protein
MIEDTLIRRCLRLLAAVHELHKQGYQDLASIASWHHQGLPGVVTWCPLTIFNGMAVGG